MSLEKLDALTDIPLPGKRNMAVHVKPAAIRALREGHPWVFEDSIRDVSFEGQTGDLAVIFDEKDRFAAVGLYDPHSSIRIKVLQHDTPAKIGRNWFRDVLQRAATHRNALQATGDTNGYRLVHGENDGLPGLIVDRYADTLVVKVYSSAWLPHLRDILPELVAVQPCSRLVLRLSRNLQETPALLGGLADGQVIYGSALEGTVTFYENGLPFQANVREGHKTGFFFDQRENRKRVRDIAEGSVLDVFAYSGGFSVYAAAGGATSVLSVDVSQPALATAKRNMALNVEHGTVTDVAHNTMEADAFEALNDLHLQRKKFNVVVIDPPAFATSQRDVDGALRAYAKLAELGSQLVTNGGWLVMASCSSRVVPKVFFQTVNQAAPVKLIETIKTGHALDHPIGFPEGEYLKCLFARVVK